VNAPSPAALPQPESHALGLEPAHADVQPPSHAPISPAATERAIRGRLDRGHESPGMAHCSAGRGRSPRMPGKDSAARAFRFIMQRGRTIVLPPSRATWMRSGSIAACLILACASMASAQVPDTVFLEELTWTEVRDAIRAGKTTIIVPTGGTEQNGPHMAIGKHNARARMLAGTIARALGDALVAPVLAYVPEGRIDPPGGHLRFAGTVGVEEETFQRVLESAGRSLRHHGFQHVVFLGDHGGSQSGQKLAAARLNREWARTATRAHAIEAYYRAGGADLRELLAARGYRRGELGSHADLADTSLALAVDPRLVRRDRLRPGTGMGAGGDGVDGDPSRATAELGRLGVERIVVQTVEAIRKSTARRTATGP
jgi:creatinine amidohydrolase/Fe(II)-dependent formamide hydrolase-like protein